MMLILLLPLALLVESSAAAAEIRVVGSDLLGTAFSRAVEAFARQNDATVRLNLRGTRPGMEELAAGRADLGLFLLPPDENLPAGALTSRVIAYQVAVVTVPAASPLTHLTSAQLRSIFGESAGGAFARWGELNLIGLWASRPIALRALSPSAGLAWPLFQQVMLTGVAARPALEFAATPEEFARRMRATENGIGVTGLPGSEVSGLRVLALAADPAGPAVGPTPEQVHRGAYPLRMPLCLAFRRGAVPDLQLFLKFLLSDEAAAALAPEHFLPLPPGVRHQLVFELEEMR